MTRNIRNWTRRASVAAGVIVLLAPVVGAKQPVGTSAQAFVRAMYRYHFAHSQRWDVTYRAYRARFTTELTAAFAAEDRWSKAHPDEVPNLDGDPLTSSQEMTDSYSVETPTLDGTDTIVPVRVVIGPETRTVRVRLTPNGASWRIANVLYDEGPDLLAILRLPHA